MISATMSSPIHVDYHYNNDTTPNLQLSERRFTDLVYSLSNTVFITGRNAPLLCGCSLCCQYCNPQRAVKHRSQQSWLHKWNCLSSVEWRGTVDFFLLPIRFGGDGDHLCYREGHFHRISSHSHNHGPKPWQTLLGTGKHAQQLHLFVSIQSPHVQF